MLSAIHRLALLLNQYANLLLTAITTAYVWLTWRSVKALRQASFREREARHLQEIKDNVAQPILSWIEGTIGHRFTGGSPEILSVEGGFDAIPRQMSHTVDDPFTARRRLPTPGDLETPDPLATWDSTEIGRISRFLYHHAKRDHFPNELGAFDPFLEEVRNITAGLVSFANECSEGITSSEFPQAARFADEDSMPEVASPWQLVVECIRSFLQGKNHPDIREQHVPPFYSFHGTLNRLIVKSTQREKAERWLKPSSEEIRKRWEGSDLPKRVRNLLSTAESVRQSMQHILFTHSLDVDCELVSGKKPRRWQHATNGKKP
ncbi:MAG TPA: hypothetical protein VMV59_08660 [Candidatus Dormibacteraeota bacterium]|nr:hypothetical protein [Candidatus Dormibacteraeota bacterium]